MALAQRGSSDSHFSYMQHPGVTVQMRSPSGICNKHPRDYNAASFRTIVAGVSECMCECSEHRECHTPQQPVAKLARLESKVSGLGALGKLWVKCQAW